MDKDKSTTTIKELISEIQELKIQLRHKDSGILCLIKK